jgi:hypothetical protein
MTKDYLCRCSDPTELGTFASSLLCEACSGGAGSLIPLSSLEMTAPWRCDRCAAEVPFARNTSNLSNGYGHSSLLLRARDSKYD